MQRSCTVSWASLLRLFRARSSPHTLRKWKRDNTSRKPNLMDATVMYNTTLGTRNGLDKAAVAQLELSLGHPRREYCDILQHKVGTRQGVQQDHTQHKYPRAVKAPQDTQDTIQALFHLPQLVRRSLSLNQGKPCHPRTILLPLHGTQ